MLKLKVKASTKYIITIDNGLNKFLDVCSNIIKGEKIAIVTDENVYAIYGDLLKDLLTNYTVYTYVLPSGENTKSKEKFFELLEKLCNDGFTRKDTIIAFGGGVIGDLAGFVASTYMRGIALIQVPTTILSAVDSSVGGKTAINLQNGKNLVGAFYQPKAVYVNTEFFKTLPQREIQSGLGEILKYALLKKSVSVDLIKQGALEKLVYQCLKIKRDIVNKDEKENNLRALLNLGHTVGHAIESLSNYKVSHGECVAKGLVFTIKASKNYFGLTDETVNQMQQILSAFNHDLNCDYSLDDIVNKMTFDKKNDGKTIKFVLLKKVGNPKIVKLTLEQIKEYIK